jgi:hypothetical protein
MIHLAMYHKHGLPSILMLDYMHKQLLVDLAPGLAVRCAGQDATVLAATLRTHTWLCCRLLLGW